MQPTRHLKSFTLLYSRNFFLLLLAITLSGCQFPGMGKKDDQAVYDSQNPCVVLALPNSGPYSAITSRIKRGAALAAEALKKNGRTVRMEEIDTENPNWLNSIAQLPAECAVVGGPLQEKTYLQARSSGIFAKKVFFAFVPNLQDEDEGKIAWKFFPSPEDQANALIRFVTEDLNIRSFGAFYPDDEYGKKMTAIFRKALEKQHLTLTSAAYDPKAPRTWAQSAQTLINPYMAEDGKTPIPQTMFEAVFLPDSWKQMSNIADSFVYNGEDRLVMLGPMLWEQGIGSKKIANSQKFALAVFPGAWRQTVLPEALKNANPDFWMALGYDFLNFAVNMGYVKPDGQQVARKAQGASSIIRALAPIRWNSEGKAAQNMYIFQVGPSGVMAANKNALLQSRSNIAEKAALRMQGQQEEPVTEEVVLTPPASENIAPPPKPAPAQPGSPALSPVPQPSYKLRLPVKR